MKLLKKTHNCLALGIRSNRIPTVVKWLSCSSHSNIIPFQIPKFALSFFTNVELRIFDTTPSAKTFFSKQIILLYAQSRLRRPWGEEEKGALSVSCKSAIRKPSLMKHLPWVLFSVYVAAQKFLFPGNPMMSRESLPELQLRICIINHRRPLCKGN